MKRTNKPSKRNLVAADLRTPKYRVRVVTNKKRRMKRCKCRGKTPEDS